MKTRRGVLLVCFFFFSFTSFSQTDYSNSVQLSFTDFGFDPQGSLIGLIRIPTEQLGIYYERRIYKHWWLEGGYNEFNTISKTPFSDLGPMISPSEPPLTVGSVQWRYDVKMADLFLIYKLRILRKHRIIVGLGSSYNWGKNIYIDAFGTIGYSYYVNYSEGPASYWGIVPVLAYDYSLFKNRLSIGADYRWRKYFGQYLLLKEYGAHIGFNF